MSINPALRQVNTPMNNVKQMMRMVQTAQNPQVALQTMMNQNPQIGEAFNFARSMNTDLRSAYYQLAARRGIDAQAFLNELLN